MCMICIEFANDRMSMNEVRKALTELVETSDDADVAHFKDLQRMSDEEIAEQAKAQIKE